MIKRHGLILKNEPGITTRLTWRNTMSIINLTFTTREIGALNTWFINGEISTPSDHEVIVFDAASLHKTVGRMRTCHEVKGWSVKGMGDEVKEEALAD